MIAEVIVILLFVAGPCVVLGFFFGRASGYGTGWDDGWNMGSRNYARQEEERGKK